MKDAEAGVELGQDVLMRKLQDETNEVVKSNELLRKGPHNATVYDFSENFAGENCATCKNIGTCWS